MRSKITVNPLMLLIMTQAWCHVKRHSVSSSSMENVDNGEKEEGAASVPTSEIPISHSVLSASAGLGGKVFKPDTWNFVWSHPFFKSTAEHGALSVRQLARHWGDRAQGLPKVSCEQSCRQALDQSKDHSLRAVLVEWDNIWANGDLPSWMVRLLNDRQHEDYQVWMAVPSGSTLSDDVCRQAVQLGWSWWFVPPDSVQGFPDYLKSSLPQWRFWFTNPQSDQWVWPWADILVKVLCERISGSPQERYWIADQRQRAAWSKLDEEAWEQLEKIMGGAGMLNSLIETTFHQLSQVDFLDRLIEQ